MSSDYLLAGLGYNPDDSAKRLGDGLYEQRLIEQAIVARTGQAFIDGQTSNEAQLKYLMDNAIASKDALNLSVGVSLTSEQVAALTHDIVWMESEVVDGQTVLVPVLYLAQANNRLAPNGALIQGSDVTLIAGKNLDNAGTLKATNNLAAMAGNDLVNSGLVSAGGRLSLLAGNDLTNKAGGIIAGRDVSLTAVSGDVINERTVTTHNSSNGYNTQERQFADSAARVEAGNDLTIQAGRDISNSGGVLQSGRDLGLTAGRDVNITSAQVLNSDAHGTDNNSKTIVQNGSSVTSGHDLTVQAGRNVTAVASQISAKNNVSVAAAGALTLASAADEQHSYGTSKKVTAQEDHVSQVSTVVTAGGDVVLHSGNDMTLVSSNVNAGKEAYLVAGGKLGLLAAQDSDYSLYDMKKSGSFGSKETQHDEVTDVKNIGSQIKTGGDLTIVSGGDQLYQGAKIESGKNLTIDSGGSITFDAVKDSHQESHNKSSNSWAWTSMGSKGQVDETLRQSQLSAKGQTLINAVDGLHIDVKDINQQSISQTIDAMVQADPSMAWLKDVEARNDVDWRQVKELHDSWDESHSGLGGPAMLIIIIIVTYFTAGAASGALGSAASATAGSTSAMSAGLAATATTQAVAAGWANAALTAVLTSAASTAAVSTINNKGNVGAALKDTFSVDNLKNYLVAAGAAGLTTGLFNDWTSTSTGSGAAVTDSTKGALANTGKVIVSSPGGLSSLQGVTQFTENQLLQNTTSALLNKALGRDGSLSDALQNSLVSAFTAYGFNLVGDIGVDNHLPDGGLAKIGLHALMGGLASIAGGGDFKTGAMAAGVNEALVNSLASAYAGMPKEEKDQLLLMNAQLIGVLTTAVQDPTAGIGKLQLGSSIAQSGTLYNRQLHPDEIEFASDDARVQRFAAENGLTPEQAQQELLRTAASMVDRGWNSVLSEKDGNTAKAADFLRAELIQAKNDHLFQVSLADYNNERVGLVDLFKDKASLDKVLKNVALVDPLDYRTDAKYMREVLNAKGEGSQEGFVLGLEGAASGASKTALWAMGAVNCPSCAAEDIQNAWNLVLSIPEELRLKGYLDNLYIMQGGGADVIRGNESASTSAGVGLGLAIDGGLAGVKLPEGSGAIGAKGVANPVSDTLARVVPSGLNPTNFAKPGDLDAFVTNASELRGLSNAQIAERLTIPEIPGGFRVIEFPSSSVDGIASPVFRTNPGFVQGGKTAGGAAEFVIPNGPIPSGATQWFPQ
ncbi:polymorphic toxin type 10 domain-containing protein [Pseudomonas sp. CCC3.2]|uniref:polymorphic toxin type 10 domain-containing protein n=2 Tax=unclassified Pseudomonas TaxID=196821 RepID=UPI00387E939F